MTTYAKRYCKVLLLSTVLCFFAVEARAKDYVLVKDKMTEFVAKGVKADTTAEDTMRYLAGGLLGTFVGFGIGHALQGRWDDDYGWVFAATQLGGIALLFVGGTVALLAIAAGGNDPDIFELSNTADSYPKENRKASKVAEVAGVIAMAGGVTWVVSRIFEIVHVWLPYSSTARSAVKRNSAHYLVSRAEPSFSISPLLSNHQFCLQLALRL